MHTMSLRLTDEDEALLAELTQVMHASRADVIRAAIRELAVRQGHRTRVADAVRTTMAEDADVLRRLGEA